MIQRNRADGYAILLLMLLCIVFFWQLITPISSDQISFKQGDFSGQFVAFGAYQYQRFIQGEIPLWNPYNNGGFPFIGDTQAAVFYPPRLLTIAISYLYGGWSYTSLQLEAVLHVMLYSFFTYAFIRRLTITEAYSIWGALAGAIIASYGGFVSGYPPLQLALLEAAIWLPLTLLGVLEATRTNAPKRWNWMIFSGFMLGLSWMAGHPQTSWFITIFLLAWLCFRTWEQKLGWRFLLIGTSTLGIVSIGTTAITLIPAAEYLIVTSRTNLSFEAKANGFPVRDLIQFLLPGTVSLYSPLFIGIPALILIYSAITSRFRAVLFWLVGAIVALLHSFGGNTVLYPILYNILPGLRFFRGQERAALLVSVTLAVLAGIGLIAILNRRQQHTGEFRFARIIFIVLAAVTFISGLGWIGGIGEHFHTLTSTALFSLLIAGCYWLLLHYRQQLQVHLFLTATLILITFELFSINMGHPAVYDPIPASQQQIMNTELLDQITVRSGTDQPFRVDGFRGLRDNYGSMAQLMDIRGISPLFLASAQRIIYQDYISNPIAWELFAVRYIFSERETLSALPTALLRQGSDRDGSIYLHELTDPRPFAHLIYHADLVDSDDFAYELLNDPRYDLRNSIILQQNPDIVLPENPPSDHAIRVTAFHPEQIDIEVQTSEPAILSLAMVDYPGWKAFVNDQQVPILRAYSTLSAIAIPAGEHQITVQYDPNSYRIGAVLSLLTWGGICILGIHWLFSRNRQSPAQE